MKIKFALIVGIVSIFLSTSLIGETLCGMVQRNSVKKNYHFYPKGKNLKGWWLQVVPLNAEVDHILPTTTESVCLTGTVTESARLGIGWINGVEITGFVGDGLFLAYKVTPNPEK